MYRRVLVGYDASDGARDALALAAQLSRIEGSELILLAALELDPLSSPPDAYERAIAETEDRLSAAARELLGEKPFRMRTIGGVSAPRALDEVAEAESADVIALGSTHREGLGRVLPGSVGERVLHGSPCAVLVAPGGYADADPSPLRLIGVGFDGQSEAGHAREAATALAADLGATLETITIGPDDGDPGEALAARSHELDLLVVGSRGYGPVRHVLVGNVSYTVMRNAACPILIVPRSAG